MAIKLGTEDKNKTYAALGLGIVVLLVGAYEIHDQFFSGPAPAPVTAPAAAPVSLAPVPSRGVSPSRKSAGTGGDAGAAFAHRAVELPGGSALDPTLHPELMAQAEATEYTGEGRNIFSMDSVPPPPPAAKVNIPKPIASIRPEQPSGPPPPPPPPNIDLKFYGYSLVKDAGAKGGGGKDRDRKAFLMHGDDIFIAKEGDVVDRRYKVVKINPFSVDVEDLSYTHTQTLPLTQ